MYASGWSRPLTNTTEFIMFYTLWCPSSAGLCVPVWLHDMNHCKWRLSSVVEVEVRSVNTFREYTVLSVWKRLLLGFWLKIKVSFFSYIQTFLINVLFSNIEFGFWRDGLSITLTTRWTFLIVIFVVLEQLNKNVCIALRKIKTSRTFCHAAINESIGSLQNSSVGNWF